jgi:hypothetical protein
MSVIDMLVVLNMFQFFCKKTMTRIDVVVLVFRYLTYHGSGMCLAAFVLWFMTVIHSFIYFFLVQWNVLRAGPSQTFWGPQAKS